ncbi:serine/threonine-protein kinase [Streptomyces sp. NPDC055254]
MKAAPTAGPEDAKPAAGKPKLTKAVAEDAENEDVQPGTPAVDAQAGTGKGAAVAESEDAKPAPAKAVPAPAGAVPDKAAPAGAVSDKAAPAGAAPATVLPDKASAKVASGEGGAGEGRSGRAKGKAGAGKAGAADEGRLLAGRYRLGEVLGKGGMGTVWRAQDETLGRTVAVKELRFGNGVDEDEKRRLITRTLREAKAIARIRSGGAVTVYDVVDEDGRPWIVMELIEGPSLAEFIRDNGPLTPHRAAEVGLAVLDVLRAAHGQGILHRDVKPSNVLIAGNGRVVLTDFGIAQVEGDPSVTSTGMLVGAPSYISPERARGYKPGPPADMWSLGGLLYASVEGVPPYDKGSALATLTAVMTEPVDPPKNAGPLTEVIYGLLAKDPAHRLDDVRARAMLAAVVGAPEPVAAPVPAPAAEETRQISLSQAKEAAERATAEKAAEKAAKKERERREREQRERARAALKSARKAAAAAVATAAAATAATAAEAPSPKRVPVVAPLTDVLPRRTIALAIAALVVVLAAVGSLVVYAFSGDGKDGRKDEGKGGGATPTASGNPSPGGSPQNTPKPGEPGAGANGSGGANGSTDGAGNSAGQQDQGQQTAGTAQGQGQDQGQGQGQAQGQGAAPGTPGGALPSGYIQITDLGFRFSMAMPEGFRHTGTAGTNSGAIYSRDGGFPRIQVDFSPTPGDDARRAWEELAPAVRGSSTGYKLIGINPTSYNNYPTVADWEFEREQKGVKVRVLNRGFKVDANRGYAIMISCAADQWDGPECTQMRNTAFQTFQPLG